MSAREKLKVDLSDSGPAPPDTDTPSPSSSSDLAPSPTANLKVAQILKRPANTPTTPAPQKKPCFTDQESSDNVNALSNIKNSEEKSPTENHEAEQVDTMDFSDPLDDLSIVEVHKPKSSRGSSSSGSLNSSDNEALEYVKLIDINNELEEKNQSLTNELLRLKSAPANNDTSRLEKQDREIAELKTQLAATLLEISSLRKNFTGQAPPAPVHSVEQDIADLKSQLVQVVKVVSDLALLVAPRSPPEALPKGRARSHSPPKPVHPHVSTSLVRKPPANVGSSIVKLPIVDNSRHTDRSRSRSPSNKAGKKNGIDISNSYASILKKVPVASKAGVPIRISKNADLTRYVTDISTIIPCKFEKVYVNINFIPALRVADRKSKRDIGAALLNSMGLTMPMYKDFSFIGKSLLEIYIAAPQYAKVLGLLKGRNVKFSTTYEPMTGQAHGRTPEEVQVCIINRLVSLYKRHHLKEMQKTILGNFSESIREAVITKASSPGVLGGEAQHL